MKSMSPCDLMSKNVVKWTHPTVVIVSKSKYPVGLSLSAILLIINQLIIVNWKISTCQ